MAYRMKHAKKTPVIRIILFILIPVFAVVFCISGYMVITETISAEEAKSAFEELTEIKKRSAEKANKDKDTASSTDKDPGGNQRGNETDSGYEGDPDGEGVDILPEYMELFAMNEDMIGWLTIEDTPIDYPVRFTPKNPEYYLRRGFNKKYSYSGVPFMDGKCERDGNHYLIYGHNMKNQTMFGTLPKYLKKDYWEKHQIIRFDTLTESREYQIMAVFRSKAYTKSDKGVFRYYAYADISDKGRFAVYVKNCLSASVYNTGITAEYGDELLTLSTCDYYTDNGRLVVVAKRIS